MDKGYEVVEQDIGVSLVGQKKKQDISRVEREVKESTGNNTDKPGYLISKLAGDIKSRLERDSKEILHGFHLNGRDIKQLHSRTAEILRDETKTKLLLAKAPNITDGPELRVMNAMMIKWGETIFSFLGKPMPAGEFLVFIKDVKSGNVYLPCCHDIKPIQPKQLINHYQSCLASKIDGSKCSFCNSTDLVNGNYSTVDVKKDHLLGNSHINSIYLVLDYSLNGLQMVDARVVDSYLLTRPFSNYFLKDEANQYGYAGFIEFLRQHFPTQNLERTPLYSTLKMYQRLATNKGRDHFKIPCEDCDCTLPTYTGFYLGKALSLERVDCVCGSDSAFKLPLKKIDEIYALVQQAIKKDNTKAGKDLLLAMFTSTSITTDSATNPLNISVVDLNDILKTMEARPSLTVVSGTVSGKASSGGNPTATVNLGGVSDGKSSITINPILGGAKGDVKGSKRNGGGSSKTVASPPVTVQIGSEDDSSGAASMEYQTNMKKKLQFDNGNASKKMVIAAGPQKVEMPGFEVASELISNGKAFVPDEKYLAITANIGTREYNSRVLEIKNWYYERLKEVEVLNHSTFMAIVAKFKEKFGYNS